MGLGTSLRNLGAAAVIVLLGACASLESGTLESRTPETLESLTLETLNAPDVAGTRWGMVVIDAETGREVVAIRPDERFMPASNTKLFTVAAAFQRLPGTALPDPASGASVRIEPRAGGAPDIALVGGGDAMLIDADDCERDCLSSLADMAALNGVKRVRDVIGDDRRFPDQRWGEGWSQEDLIYRMGAPASALVVNSNEVDLQVAPGEKAGDAVSVAWRGGDEFFKLAVEAITVEGDEDSLRIERLPGSDTVRVFGSMGVGVRSQVIPMVVEDPALTAAWRFRRLLEARGITIEGEIRARHRPLALSDEPEARAENVAAPDPSGVEIGRLLPSPLIEDIRFLMKESQNLHAEMLLRRLGLIEGGGSVQDGLAIVGAVLTGAGAAPGSWDLSDGSGMSAYNRVTPRMVARFLRWTTTQPWSEAFRDTLPVGGVDGTLERRFKGTPLEGRVFAKTGTLNSANALSGFMLTKSGKTLIFSAYANDRPSAAPSATAALDAALNAIAAAY
jgi:D-alanyl-D-alanine carboxypeptidase/D-alanyl-D-alanine-endopeptidase (penicillin-binding protein 4)